MPTYAKPSNDDSECPSNAELSRMEDNGKSQDNGSATITVLFRTTKSSQRKFPKKLKKKKRKKKKRKTPIYINCDKLNLGDAVVH